MLCAENIALKCILLAALDRGHTGYLFVRESTAALVEGQNPKSAG